MKYIFSHKINILIVGLVLSVTGNAFSQTQTTEAAEKQFLSIAADYEKNYFDYVPEDGLLNGKLDVPLDRFTDYSLSALKQWQAEEDAFQLALSTIDENALKHSPSYTTYLLLKQTIENNKAIRICQERLWDVNSVFGWHNKLAMTAAKQPVGTATYRQLALKRWRQFDRVVDAQLVNLKQGLRLGFTAPKPVVERVLAQLKMMINLPIEQSPYFDFAKRDNDPEFKKQVAHLIETQINPSLKKYIHFLEMDYLPLARSEISIAAMPPGALCYQAELRNQNTLSLSPQEIHAIGLQSIENLNKEIAAIGQKKYGTSDITVIFERAKNEAQHDFASEKELIDYNLRALAKVNAKVPAWFKLVPKAAGIIQPYPLHRAMTGASGEYQPPSDDGKEPGIFFINTYQPQNRSRIDQEATLYHELIPGHHFQIALAYENKALPHVNRYLGNAGFQEGWALYVERLADEMGLYEDDISRLGMLSNESLRAARLVVDTGIHALNWKRQEAVNYLKQHTALDAKIIEGEVDRYIIMPGQATAYMLGKHEIERLRSLAKEKLGANFDIREFHEQILKNGMTSLPILKKQLEAWIESKSTAGK